MFQNDRPHRRGCRPQARLTLPFRKARRLVSIGFCALAAAIGSSPPAVAIDGHPDPVFDADGLVLTDIQSRRRFDVIRALVVQPDGKVLAVGRSTSNNDSDFALARYHPNGSLDTSLDADGLLRTDFSGTGSEDRAFAVTSLADQKLIVSGVSTAGGSDDFALARYATDGSLDPGFDVDGMVLTDFSGTGSLDRPSAQAQQPDGKIVVAGRSTARGSVDFALARYNPDGSLDPGFDSEGLVVTNFGAGDSFDRAFAVAIQPDGQVVAGGQSDATGSVDFALARYHTFEAFCAGRAVTVLGTPADDTLHGTAGADVIDSLAGNDVVNGLGGDDILCGGPGHDTLAGGGGRDRIFGGPGRDRLRGGPGNDWLARRAKTGYLAMVVKIG